MSRSLTTATAVVASAILMTVAGSSASHAADVNGRVVVPGPGVVVGPPVAAQPYVNSYAQVAPADKYYDMPIVIGGQRYYRDCWWEWDRRVCALKPWY